MDKAGIGTDATMHDHIKKLLDRCYATKDTNMRFSPTNLGEALVMGYDDMGYELWKPYLRSMMESDMKAVSTGTKRKSEVLESCLQQMKTCFLDAKRNKVKLLEAMEMFFERSGGDTHIVEERVRLCSMCNDSDMVLKRKPSGDFMVGCQRYPLCRNVVWLPGSISEAVVTSHVCPSCTPGPVLMIQFKFRRLEIPPNYDVDHLGCIGGCDAILRELVEICGTGSRNHAGTSGRGQGGMEPPSSLRTVNSRANSCIHCRQTDHSSDDCPSHTSHSRGTRSNSSRGAQSNSSRGTRSNSIQNSRNSTGSVLCNSCGEPGVLRTANTESNRGRKFYTCQSQECGFFVWEDSLETGGDRGRGPSRGRGSRSASTAGGDRGRGSSRGRGSRSASTAGGDRASTTRRGGRGRGQGSRGASEDGERFVSATGDPVSGRCYICGDPSHFANACPNRGG